MTPEEILSLCRLGAFREYGFWGIGGRRAHIFPDTSGDDYLKYTDRGYIEDSLCGQKTVDSRFLSRAPRAINSSTCQLCLEIMLSS